MRKEKVMKLTNIPVADTEQSKTNIKGRNGGESFIELVASIKEKGILVPLLARGRGESGKKYEIIAGNRRLAAAKELGLETIPVQLVKMTDNEAREAQIIENLQRADVHPLDEGELYRKLIEEAGYDTLSVGVKVGKLENYIKQRLYLTNLEERPAEKYRNGKILDGHAVLIAKLGAEDQMKALSAVTSNWGGPLTVNQLASWINENIYTPLRRQPWLKSKEAMEAVGQCIECEPKRASLFGDVKEGECTNVKCWTRKMRAYISWRVKEGKLVRVNDEFASETPKGVLKHDEYVIVGKKQPCKTISKAIVVSGTKLFKELDICSNKSCSVHSGMTSQYQMTPKEQKNRKATRKKEIAKAKKVKTDRQAKIAEALKRIKWPLTGRGLEALYALCYDQANSSARRNIAKRRELDVKKVKDGYGGSRFDYDGAIKESVKAMDQTEMVRLAFEFLIDSGYDSLRDGVGQLLK